MDEGAEHQIEQQEPKPGLPALLAQLGDDTRAFARAEMRYFQAQAGERAQIAVPALYMIVASMVLMLSVIVALVVGAILLLSPLIGAPLASLIVAGVAALIAWLMFRTARTRIMRVFRKLED